MSDGEARCPEDTRFLLALETAAGSAPRSLGVSPLGHCLGSWTCLQLSPRFLWEGVPWPKGHAPHDV